MPIVDDDKDWTWVLGRPCPECGFDAVRVTRESVPTLVRAGVPTWFDVLQRSDVRERPDDTTWSPLEYACHVRDVCRIFDDRLLLMLDQHDPVFANWDQDETARTTAYGEQAPDTVSTELAAASESLAARFASLSEDQWTRPGRRSNGSVFTVESFARYLVHDLRHHVHDVTDRAS